ncbi:metallophosphoesterase family protein [Tanticharoenia sakaeratensis]|uniref:Metallophosphoesterase n=1 Tax=Tanticharoenia sakaeratensis NBRC 103193 TaxID=1231623 RepID=A0A0D6MHG8_9PROT|nr:DNA repair exonuclease [Tanticharoenia sakaeratensis]GAN53089.1 metallophosphoesterase [Tanticharoenia sakaeratensis NBRC 103193]GBQ20478.1 exonuclease [Tanticharoenia sakaeratensis NBRC 103193]
MTPEAVGRSLRRVMTSFSFLHAADLHLDSPLRGLSRYPGLPVDTIRQATRSALDTLVTTAIERGVDFVILAGDLYDGEWQDAGTGLHMASALGRLAAAGIPVFLARGNHDAASILMRDLTLPPMVHRFAEARAETVRLDDIGVALHGRGFAKRHIAEDMTPGYPEPVSGYFNIGVLHTSLAGYEGHEPYAPTTPERLIAKGYDYWALGHVHERQVVSMAPPIVFPGVLQGRHIRETGPKGATLVRVTDGRPALEHIACDCVRWARIEVDCTGIETDDALHAAIRTTLEDAACRLADGRLLVARLALDGETALHARLGADFLSLRDATREIAAMTSSPVAIEKITVATRPPARAETDGPDADLLDDVLDGALADPALLELLAEDLGAFTQLVPQAADPMDTSSPLVHARAGDWNAILARAADALRARLGDPA